MSLSRPMNSSPTVSPLCTPLNGYSEAHSSRPSRLTELIFSLYEHFSFYYTAAFVPLGLVLNVLVLLVFLLPHRRRPRAFGAHREQSMVRRRSVASSTTRLYYMMMACGELGALLFKDIWIFFLSSGIDTLLGAGAGRSSSSGYRSGNMTVSGSEIGTGPGAEAGGFLGPANAHRSAAACSLALFLSYVHELTANNVLIVFEIERVIVLYQPFVARKWLSHSRAFSIVALVVISDVAVCAGSFQSSRIINVQLPLSSNQQRSEAHVNDMDGAGVQLEFRFMKLCILSSSVPFWNAWAAFVFFATFVWPAVVSFVCSALITFKIVRHQHIQRELSEHLRVQRMHNTQSLHQQYISRRELNVCIAYLMRASATVVFYLPVSALRITAMLLPLFLNGTNSATSSTSTSTFANSNSTAASILTTFKSREQGDMSQLWAENPDVWAETRSEYAQQLLGAGLLAHVFVIPVHCINFLLCWSRVPGFARNVRRLLALKPLEHYDIR